MVKLPSFSQNYESIKNLRAGHHKIIEKHEFHIIGKKSDLVQIYQPKLVDWILWDSSKEQQWISDASFQYLDIENGWVSFEWFSLDNVLPEESALPVDEY